MKTFSINTLGCKVNQYESQQIRELLERLGLNHVEISQNPDLAVVNTCCVTLSASAKSRQHIQKARRLNPDVIIVVCGCLPTVQIGELNYSDEKNVHLIRHRNNLAATLGQIVAGKAVNPDFQSSQAYQNAIIKTENGTKIKCKNKLANQPGLAALTSFKDHTRAFLKIQDGCDGHCSYCIIPKTRPYVHSKPPEAVLQEAQGLVKAGHKEIVVTGIFLGAYGRRSVGRKYRDCRQNNKLAELLDKMAEIPNLARIRLSSLEPADVTQRLLDTFCEHRNIMPHLHLSLQSGSDTILKKMCRQYRTDEFMRTVESIKSRLDRPAITADIIVGFPGETDTDFQKTFCLAKDAGFAKMHIFRFSPRKGTAAAGMQDTVDIRVIKERAKIMRDLDAELGYKFRQQFVGEIDTVLVENSNGPRPSEGLDETASGRSERYFMVWLEKAGGKPKKNELVRVKLVENKQNGVVGQPQVKSDFPC